MSKTKSDMETLVHQNRVVWDETMRYSDRFGKQAPSIVIREIPEMPRKLDNPDRVVKVFNATMLDVAEKLSEKNLNPLVVNAGSDNDPLRVLADGAIGTEWDLFRRSNLHAGITGADCYPLRNGAILYSPEVTVFRTDNFKLMRNPFKISVVTVPPVRRPGLVSSRFGDTTVDSYQNDTEADRMKTCIDKIFQVALAKGHRCIVIDDFGCQKNCENPIDKVIEMFNDAIKRYPVKYVMFAVAEPPLERLSRDIKKNNPIYKNYVAFDTKIIRS